VVIDLIDLKRQEILTMLSDLPDKESRMVGVINKCDRKQENAENWVWAASILVRTNDYTDN